MYQHLVRIVLSLIVLVAITSSKKEIYIDDFTENGDPSNWTEHSDTIYSVGESKANFLLQQTATSRKALLFTLLKPQPSGAAFAGIKKLVNFDLRPFRAVRLKVRGQGQHKGYKLIFQQTGSNYSFCNFFKAPRNFRAIRVPFSGFKAYKEGQLVERASAKFNKTHLNFIGIHAYGGRYLPMKQSGVSCLEIDWIRLE